MKQISHIILAILGLPLFTPLRAMDRDFGDRFSPPDEQSLARHMERARQERERGEALGEIQITENAIRDEFGNMKIRIDVTPAKLPPCQILQGGQVTRLQRGDGNGAPIIIVALHGTDPEKRALAHWQSVEEVSSMADRGTRAVAGIAGNLPRSMRSMAEMAPLYYETTRQFGAQAGQYATGATRAYEILVPRHEAYQKFAHHQGARALAQFALDLMNIHASNNATIYTLNWQGPVCSTCRESAGKEVADLVYALNNGTRTSASRTSQPHFYLIGYGHGGNVALHAVNSLSLRPTITPIKALINIFTPNISTVPKPAHGAVNQYLNLYSRSDVTQQEEAIQASAKCALHQRTVGLMEAPAKVVLWTKRTTREEKRKATDTKGFSANTNNISLRYLTHQPESPFNFKGASKSFLRNQYTTAIRAFAPLLQATNLTRAKLRADTAPIFFDAVIANQDPLIRFLYLRGNPDNDPFEKGIARKLAAQATGWFGLQALQQTQQPRIIVLNGNAVPIDQQEQLATKFIHEQTEAVKRTTDRHSEWLPQQAERARTAGTNAWSALERAARGSGSTVSGWLGWGRGASPDQPAERVDVTEEWVDIPIDRTPPQPQEIAPEGELTMWDFTEERPATPTLR